MRLVCTEIEAGTRAPGKEKRVRGNRWGGALELRPITVTIPRRCNNGPVANDGQQAR